MNCLRALILVLVAWPTYVAAATGEPSTVAARRFALIASSNDGGAGRPHLRFANSDATSMVRVLTHLGGVQAGDLHLVTNATRASLQSAMERLAQRILQEKKPKERSELFLYFSGHSDEEGLLLANDRVSYAEVRSWMEKAAADVRIGILDSCASGALIRRKGGTHRPPFLNDASTQARGHAYLTASSADEAAQESDRVGAAYFTHFLVSGLRGAADANGDQRVTLMEAYQFAYSETLQRTQTSQAGAQHPNYDIQLAGSGDLVMTDLHASTTRLVLARSLAGRIYIRDNVGRLIVELRKEPTYPVELGLEPGNYTVIVDRDGQLAETKLILLLQGRLEVDENSLRPIIAQGAVRRGGAHEIPNLKPGASTGTEAPTNYRKVKFDLVLAPGFRLSGQGPQPVHHTLVLGVLGHSDSFRGAQISMAGNIVMDRGAGVQIANALSLAYGPFRGLQLSAINLALGGLGGVQLAYFANLVRGPRHGVQVALLNMASGPSQGAQVGLVNLEHHDLNGVQVGLVNATKGTLRGAQVGLTNLSLTTEETRGAQVGLVNLTGQGSLASLSMIGLVNVGQRATAQIGLINIAHEISGLQLGLVNLAHRNHGASIGFLPLVFDGDNRLTVSWSDRSLASVGFKLGTRRVYVLGQFGITRGSDNQGNRLYSSSIGIGGHLIARGGRFLLDLDAMTSEFHDLKEEARERRWVHSLRLQMGYWLYRHLAIVGGPALHVQHADADYDKSPSGPRLLEKTWTSGTTVVRMYPGFFAGLEF